MSVVRRLIRRKLDRFFVSLQSSSYLGSTVYEMVGKSVILVCKKTKRGQQTHFMAVKKTRKLPGLVAIYSYCKDNAFTAVKRDAEF